MSQSPAEGDLDQPLEMASMKSRFGSFKSTRGTAYSLRRGSGGTSSKKITCVVYLLEEKTQEWTLDVRRLLSLGVWKGGGGVVACMLHVCVSN